MEDKQLPTILNTIKNSSNKAKIYHNLKLLRRIVDDKAQFTQVRESGGLRLILTLLPNKQIEITDIILSIIGNCCMERDCAKEVVKYHGLKILVDVLKKWKQDSVNCRVFRILGNISQFDNYASEIIKYDFVSVILKLLEPNNEDVSMDTEGMAVRTLRLFWQSYSNRQSMIQDGVIRTVATVLIKHTKKWAEKTDTGITKKQREKLLENVLKCLLVYTKTGTLECAQQILADGSGFKSLVILIDLYPYPAVKCITNLSPVAKSRADMDISTGVTKVLEKIRYYINKKPFRGCPSEIITTFCLFSKHPLNCCEVKHLGGIPLILQVLSNCKSKRQEFQILQAIPGFLYDEGSQEILVSSGIIKILIDCLERNLKSSAPLNESHTYVRSKKRVRETPAKKLKLDLPSPDLREVYQKMNMLTGQAILTGCLTPSDSECSPLSSPSCTPPRNNTEDDDDDSVNYSPVCSDNEEATTSIPSLLSPQFEESDCESEKEHFQTSDIQEKSIIIMLIILSRISFLNPYPTDLREHRTIVTLLKYLRESKYPQGRVTDILLRTVTNIDNIIPLIMRDTVYAIHSLTQMQHDHSCAKCARLKDVADDLLEDMAQAVNCSKGTSLFVQQMKNESLDLKILFVSAVPYVVKAKNLLQNLMDSCGGLSFLLSQFLNNYDKRYRIVGALSKLSCSVNVSNPSLEKITNKILKFPDKYDCGNNCQNIITIRLDDGNSLIADKDFLISNVEYFKAMLSGSFREAEQDNVRLKNVSYEALNCLLYLLKKDIKNIKPCPIEIDLSVILELITLSDSYLLEHLNQWLLNCVESYMLNIDSVSEIYKWSIESGTSFLRVESVAYLLTGKMNDNERYRVCERIIECDLIQQLHDDFEKIIFRFLKMR